MTRRRSVCRCVSRYICRRRRRSGEGAGAVLSRGSHLHRGDISDQGRRAALCGTAWHCADRAGHQSARSGRAGRKRGVGLRRGCGLLCRRDCRSRGRSTIGCTPTCATNCARRCSPNCRWTAIGLGIFGHSMGGHGALMLALRNPEIYRSVSAFAPIAAPSRCPWGEKAFAGYLGEDREAWKAVRRERTGRRRASRKFAEGILIDQGLADQFLAEQLYPDVFEAACQAAGQPLTLRRHEGYDHGYYFISTFIEDIAHHARVLCRWARHKVVACLRADVMCAKAACVRICACRSPVPQPATNQRRPSKLPPYTSAAST